MHLRTLFAVSGFALLSVSAASQDGLGGPVAGLIVDEQTRAVRAVLGLPGSAHAAASRLGTVDFAAAAPNGRSALIAKKGSLYLVKRVDLAEPQFQLVRESVPAFAHAVFTPDSNTVALLDTGNKRIELVSGLNSEARSREGIDVSSLAGSIVSLAVARDGEYVFASVQDSDEAATLYLLKSGDVARPLHSLGRAGALLLQGDVLWAADPGRNEVLRIANWADAPQIESIATEAHGVNNPVGLTLSADAKRLFVASAGTRQIVAMDLATREVTAALDLGFTPTRLERSGSMLLLTSPVAGEQPAQVFDAERMSVFFVPVSKEATHRRGRTH